MNPDRWRGRERERAKPERFGYVRVAIVGVASAMVWFIAARRRPRLAR
jgi:hypothetical protein